MDMKFLPVSTRILEIVKNKSSILFMRYLSVLKAFRSLYSITHIFVLK